MPTTNYDASDYLKFRTNRVLYAANRRRLEVATVYPEQQPYSEAAVLLGRREGGGDRWVDGRLQVAGAYNEFNVVIPEPPVVTYPNIWEVSNNVIVLSVYTPVYTGYLFDEGSYTVADNTGISGEYTHKLIVTTNISFANITAGTSYTLGDILPSGMSDGVYFKIPINDFLLATVYTLKNNVVPPDVNQSVYLTGDIIYVNKNNGKIIVIRSSLPDVTGLPNLYVAGAFQTSEPFNPSTAPIITKAAGYIPGTELLYTHSLTINNSSGNDLIILNAQNFSGTLYKFSTVTDPLLSNTYYPLTPGGNNNINAPSRNITIYVNATNPNGYLFAYA
jgi:hypothetical protein